MSSICIPIPSSTVIGVPSVPASLPNSEIMRVEPTITSLTGGAATALDYIKTEGDGAYPVGIMVTIVIDDAPAVYQLVVSAAASNPPYVVYPADRVNKLWIKRL